jgi:hypothetical protein
MAAPPAKPSPSNQEVKQQAHDSDVAATTATTTTTTTTESKNPTTTIQLKAPPSYSVKAAAPATAAAAAMTVPSYESTESCESYKLAKQLLNNGNFEEALSVLEEEIESTKEILSTVLSDSTMMDDVELHESIAPLHYLYGTTLLYSIEEAKDGNDANAMTTINATVVPSGEAENQDDEEEEEKEEEEDSKPSPEEKAAAAAAEPQDSNNTSNPWAHLPSSKNTTPAVASAVAAVAAAGPEEDEEEGYEYYDEDAPQPSQGDDAAEDIQIAWENLEAARTIVERMVTLPGLSEHMESKLKL